MHAYGNLEPASHIWASDQITSSTFGGSSYCGPEDFPPQTKVSKSHPFPESLSIRPCSHNPKRTGALNSTSKTHTDRHRGSEREFVLEILREIVLVLFVERFAVLAMAMAKQLAVQVHNPGGSLRVVSTKPMPGMQWIKALTNVGCRVEV